MLKMFVNNIMYGWHEKHTISSFQLHKALLYVMYVCVYVCVHNFTLHNKILLTTYVRHVHVHTYTNINLHNMIQTNYLIYVYLVHLSSNKGYTIFLIHTHTAHTHTLHSYTYWLTHKRIYIRMYANKFMQRN